MAEYLVKHSPKRRPTHPGAILRDDVLPAMTISVSKFAAKPVQSGLLSNELTLLPLLF